MPVAWIVGVGPTRGLGAALARRFASGGMHVVITGRTKERLDVIAQEVNASGGRATVAPGDITESSFIQKTLDEIGLWGKLDVAIFNAGGNQWKPTLEMTDEFFESVWRLCCMSGFVFGRETARVMLERGRGTLLFTGASASLRGRAQFTAFAAAKAGLRMVSQSMAREFGPLGIHVAHVIVDGLIDGDRAREVASDGVQSKGADGLLKPEAIAEAYWQLHAQHRSAWTQELDLRPFSESF
jgi:NAD(P)-dependent dehydrogenase (short-subunit alcohol dehydrogenase family)